MIVTIQGVDYECRTATKKDDKVILYLGKYDDHGNEITSTFINFPDEDIVGLDLTEPTWQDRIEAQVTYTALITDSLLPEEKEEI